MHKHSGRSFGPQIYTMFYIYFIRSQRNQKVYVGRTNKEPIIKVEEHNKGSNTWTRQNRPFKLIYYESYFCLKDVVAREKFYKMGFGKMVKKLIIETLKNSESSSDG